MKKQRIFTSSYVRKLKENLKSGKAVPLYQKEKFEYNPDETLMYPDIIQPESLAEKMNPKNDYESAIVLFEAYPNLTRLQASDERFWTYLSHVDLYPYMIKRWYGVISGKVNDKEKKIEYIYKHWFLKSVSHSELMRNTLSGFWWSVYLSKDESREDKYELTKILFRNQTLRTRTLGTYKFFRHREAVLGFLEFFKENQFREIEKTHQIFTEYINLLGGFRELAALNKEDYKRELQKKLDELKLS